MFEITYPIIFIFILLVLFVIVLISSIPYSNNNEETEPIKTKSFENNKSSYMNNIRPEIIHNCNVLNIKSVNKNTGYSITGKFNQSCLSVYKNEKRIHSVIIDDYKNVILGSNHNILPPLIKLSKYKNILIPLENEVEYTVVFDKTEEISIKNYVVNQNISFNQIEIKYNINQGFNEYDIHYYTNRQFNIKDINYYLEKVHISNYKKFDEWEFNQEGQYTMVIVNNLYNLDIIDKYTNDIVKIRKSNNPPELIFKNLINPNIIIKNLDFVADKKDINTEYVELINGPVNLIERFMKGKKNKKINYSMMINNKVIIFKN